MQAHALSHPRWKNSRDETRNVLHVSKSCSAKCLGTCLRTHISIPETTTTNQRLKDRWVLSVLHLIASLIRFDSQQSRCAIKAKCQRVYPHPPKKRLSLMSRLMIIALRYTVLYCLTWFPVCGGLAGRINDGFSASVRKNKGPLSRFQTSSVFQSPTFLLRSQCWLLNPPLQPQALLDLPTPVSPNQRLSSGGDKQQPLGGDSN